METKIISIVLAILALAIFLFIAKRVLRLAIKLTLAGLVILVLLVGAGVAWWNGWFDSSQTKPQPRSAPTRPVR